MNTPRPAAELTLYTFPRSGHAHRAELFLSLLGLPHTRIDLQLRAGEQKKPEFLALNPFGQVPVLRDGDFVLADSNAILVYLATGYGRAQNIDWLPSEPAGAARVQHWLSVAAGPLAAGPARARIQRLFGPSINYDEARQRADALLPVIEGELAQREYLAGAAPTLADIANYSYIAHAPEGDIPLEPFPAIRAWLARIEALPGFTPMRALSDFGKG